MGGTSLVGFYLHKRTNTLSVMGDTSHEKSSQLLRIPSHEGRRAR